MRAFRARTLDPAEVLSYDTDKYEPIKRGSYSLHSNDFTWGAGWLLDIWSTVTVDREENVVTLCTYRPTGDPILHSGRVVAEVAKKCIAMHIEDT